MQLLLLKFFSSEDKTTSFPNWYENLDKTSKLRKNRSSNLVIFGLAESKSILTSEIEKFDVELFAKLIGELEVLNKLLMNNNIKFQIDEIKRLNSKKEFIAVMD